jgi:hypothetical protein
MLVATALDPTLLKEENFLINGYLSQMKQLFRGINENGIIIVDPGCFLKKNIETALKILPTSHKQLLLIYWQEFLRSTRKRVVSCSTEKFGGLKIDNDSRNISRIALTCDLDAVFTPDVSVRKRVAIESYEDSDFEIKRRNFVIGPKTIDCVPKKEVDDLIIRSIRYSRWLRFYDKIIGKGEIKDNNISEFQRGIAYILRLWEKHGHFITPDSKPEVVIITTEKEPILRNISQYVVEKRKGNNTIAYGHINKYLMEPLQKSFPNMCIKLEVKCDPHRITHMRHLEAQVAIIQFDTGFDLFKKKSDKFRRNKLTLSNNDAEHLQQYRSLPTADYLTEGRSLKFNS